ncbi:hypothetical protein [Streptomyces sp. YU58]|uniref:hypothetical protein n=1 Tax=Streptomyces sp. SX92 TaxID=3158972 RepID=UPI0027BAC456|nr:hypothetical protein [Streptomyces coralus]WLW53767.1 hypothetical protein QU709_21420 [Streptomyces coralus]
MTAPHTRSGGDLRVLRATVFAAVCVVLAAAGHALASCAAIPLWTLGVGFLGTVLLVAPLAGRSRSLPGIAALLTVGQTALHMVFGLGQHGTTAASATGAAVRTATAGAAPVSDASLVAQAARLVCGATAAAISPAQAQRILTNARIQPAGGTDIRGTALGSAHHPADAMSTAVGSPMSVLPSLPMLLGHLLAAVATGWLLRRGDLALLRLVELSAYSAHSVAEGALVRSLRGALALVRALRAGLPGAPEAGARPPRTAMLASPAPRTTALQHSVIRRGPPGPAAFSLAA